MDYHPRYLLHLKSCELSSLRAEKTEESLKSHVLLSAKVFVKSVIFPLCLLIVDKT